MRIGIIGAGFAGRALARLAVRHGYDVMLSNARDPATLPATMLRCKVGTATEAASFGNAVLIVLPFAKYATIAPGLLSGKLVLHAGDYDPRRDGPIAELDNRGTTASALVAGHFKGAAIVKALNTIAEKEIERDARPTGSANRRALPIAGDSDQARREVAALLDRLGFDVVDAGPLSEGWRFEPGRPAYGVPLDRAALTAALAAAGAAPRVTGTPPPHQATLSPL
jgi:8-hydroxy-5-deazaflavin:NADPH oxidoreductase